MFSTEQQAIGAGVLTALLTPNKLLRDNVDRPVLSLVEEGSNVRRIPSLVRSNPALAESLLAKAHTSDSFRESLRPFGKAKRMSLGGKVKGSILLGIPAFAATGSLGSGVYNKIMGGDEKETAAHLSMGLGLGSGLLLGSYGASKAFDLASKASITAGRSPTTRLLSRYSIPLVAAGIAGYGGITMGSRLRDKLKEKLLGTEASQGVTLADLDDASPSTLNLG